MRHVRTSVEICMPAWALFLLLGRCSGRPLWCISGRSGISVHRSRAYWRRWCYCHPTAGRQVLHSEACESVRTIRHFRDRSICYEANRKVRNRRDWVADWRSGWSICHRSYRFEAWYILLAVTSPYVCCSKSDPLPLPLSPSLFGARKPATTFTFKL
jgi:hypothetical protein